MLKNTYYTLKPFLPWPMRIALRRWHAFAIRNKSHSVWPIDRSAAAPPAGWSGWPNGKRFALVLTHDVETRRGLDRCEALIEMEIGLGFRSSFNFVPEGEYSTPRELRQALDSNGFEVGVHDFRHDGRLFFSRAAFKQQASRIKNYLKEWNAVGFRSGFMHRNLEWMHDLGVRYDASTFDTDPFEWQPEGVRTVFPFWVPAPEVHASSRPSQRATTSSLLSDTRGYVELPYTLPQDSTLFVLFRDNSIDIWKRKLDWIAQSGGMALLIVHPDYMKFEPGSCSSREYPASFYQEFLEYVHRQYADQYWLALPRQVAEHTRQMRSINLPAQVSRDQFAASALSVV